MEALLNRKLKDIEALPFVTLESGEPLHIHLVPLNNGHTGILLLDASEDHRQKQDEQQIRNELTLSHQRQLKTLEQLQTARRHIEDKNQQLQKANEEKSRFIANMSHEFRTPLTSIIGYNDLLKRIINEPPQSVEYVDAIERNANNLLIMIDNLLDQAGIEAGTIDLLPQPISVEKLMREILTTLKPLAARKGLELAYQIIDATPGDVLLDSLRLRQVMLNIVNNAIKYTAKGQVTFSSDWKNNWLTITIEDSGSGIPDDETDNIFKPYYRVINIQSGHQQGSGLGLSISKNLVERMGGEISCINLEPQGARFTIEIPAISISEETNDNEIESDNPAIVICEADPDIRLLLEINLEQLGFNVITCMESDDVVSIAKNDKPDLMLINIGSHNDRGTKAVRAVRKNGFKGPLIGLTDPSARNEALDAGCNDCIPKPLNIEDLYAVLASYSAGNNHSK